MISAAGPRPRPRDPGHPRGLRRRRRHGARPPSPSSPSHHLITNSIISSSHLRAYLLCTILKGGYDLSLSAHLRCTRPQMHTTTAVSWRASTKTGTCWRTRPLLWPGGAPSWTAPTSPSATARSHGAPVRPSVVTLGLVTICRTNPPAPSCLTFICFDFQMMMHQ